MKYTSITFALALLASPVQADEPMNKDIEEGSTLLEQGARLLLKGLISEMEPALKDMTEGMEEFAFNVEPMMRDLARIMGDISNYHAPEILPNGDIIIRRKVPGEIVPDGEIDI